MSDISQILLEEYKLLWSYYTAQINILAGYRELYIKIFLVPASVLSTAALALFQALPQQTAISPETAFGSLGILLIIAFLIGLALYTSYYKELGNLGNYEAAMNTIRARLAKENDLIAELSIDKIRHNARISSYRKKHKFFGFYVSILFSLGAIFITGNSFMITLAIVFLSIASKGSSITITVEGAVVIFIVAFIGLSFWSYNLYYFYTGAKDEDLSN